MDESNAIPLEFPLRGEFCAFNTPGHRMASQDTGFSKQRFRIVDFVSAAFLAVFISAVLYPPESSAEQPLETAADWTLPSDAAIESLLAERMAHNGVGMVVGVIDAQGTRVFSYGRSGAHNGRPLDGDTVFQIGSVSKPFASLLLSDMVLRAEVAFDHPAADYLPPGVKMPQKGRPITLRDLADHVSGLPRMPDNFDLQGVPNPFEAYSLDDLHTFLSGYTPVREPGAKEEYSNLGVALLGQQLSTRMGSDYETLLKERVLEPLDMDSTSIQLNSEQLERLAPGHDLYLQPVYTWEMATLQASGSLRSTTNDLLKLLAAYLGYSETPLDGAVQLQLAQSLGWGEREGGVFSHSGGKTGYRSGVAFNPSTGVGAVVLANARTYDQPIAIALHLVTGEPLLPPYHAPASKPRVSLPRTLLDRYAGRYRNEAGDELELARLDHQLLVEYPSGSILEFAASGPREFFYIGGNDDILIDADSQGQVTGLTLYGSGKSFETGGKQYRKVAEQ